MIILFPISLKSFSLFIITILLLLHNKLGLVIAQLQETPKLGYSVKERDSLHALKSSLNHPYLNSVWLDPHCQANVSKWHGIRCDSDGLVTEIVLESMGLRATIGVNALTSFAELSVLSFKNNSLNGTLMDFTSNRKLTHIDLSRNSFSGQIPVSLLEIPYLETILLQENSITGPIPEFSQASLRKFNVSNNDLIGSIPETRVLQAFPFESYSGNPRLCGSPSPTACEPVIRTDSPAPAATDSSEDKTKQTSLMGSLKRYLLVFDFVLLVGVILLFIWYLKKARNLKMKMRDYAENTRKEERIREPDQRQPDHQDQSAIKIIDEQEEDRALQHRGHHRRSSSSSANDHSINTVAGKDRRNDLIFIDENVHDRRGSFDMSELLKASAEGLGLGTFGNCYKAMMAGKAAVVVKRLRNLKPLTAEEFEKQLRLIAEQKHPNLLPILAYQNAKDEKLLIYKYVERGNLFDRIHGGRGVDGGPSTRTPFRWSSRLCVARGVARALSHLHRNMASLLVPHGNLKSSNVLLGPGDAALVSDYGVASLVALPVAAQRTTSYRSPEYNLTTSAAARRVSRKSDVWSYGCLLLELLTGKVCAHSAPPGARGSDLAAWVHKAVREEWTAEIFDREIFAGRGGDGRRFAVPGALRLLEIAMQCVERSPEKRPEMAEVAGLVEEIQCSAEQSDQGEDEPSVERSLTDDSISTVASGVSGDHDRIIR